MLKAFWSPRLSAGWRDVMLWWAWCVLSLLFVVLAPSQLWDGVPLRQVPIRGFTQALLAGCTFLGLVGWIGLRASTPRGVSWFAALLAAAFWYGASYVVFAYVRPEIAYSRGQFLVSSAIGVTLACLPLVFASTMRALRVAALGAAVVALLLLGYRGQITGAPTREIIPTALRSIAKDTYFSAIPPVRRVRGGAIEPYGDGFVVVTSDGDFFSLHWPAGSTGTPDARRLPIALPPDSVTAGEDPSQITEDRLGEHRILDLKIDSTTSPETVFVSSQEFKPAERCYVVRVSMAPFVTTGEAPAKPAAAWKQIFESTPCLPAAHPAFKYLESGGRMAFFEGRILLTVGDFGMGHVLQPAPSQVAESSHGKVLLLDREGHHEVFTTGHRNPQGLLVAGTRIWLTEHGPQGGDEVNLLERGWNYGWPLATYGTEYGRQVWPLAPRQHDHGAFTEPVHAFVPSIAISNLIRVEASALPEWTRDLLVGSLNTASLYRLRVREDRIIYVERIPMRARIRDLAEGTDGRLVLWTDSGNVIAITPGPSRPIGSVVFARCQTCHESPPGPESLGPSIRGIVGAEVARGSGYKYTPALSKLGGRWTEERLDAFLKDPGAFAPGSNMATGQVPDDQERRAVIEFLKSYK